MIRNLVLGALAAVAVPAPAAPVTERVQVETDGTTSLSHEVVVAAPVEQVWAAIATVEGWKTWAVPTAWAAPDQPDIFETSYNPAATPGDAMNIKNEFRVRVPGERLVFRTIKAPEGFPHFEALRQVNQTFELTREGKGTRVRLTGTGYGNSEAGKAVLAFFKGGNRVSLEMLRDRFESGPIDWTEKLKKPLK